MENKKRCSTELEMHDDERRKMLTGLALSAASLLIMLVVMLYASHRSETQDILALEFKKGIKKCDEEKVERARPADRVAVLSPADKSDLERHLEAQGEPVPENSAILIMREIEHPEPAFIFIKALDETSGICVNGMIDALYLSQFYTNMVESYFPGSTIPANAPRVLEEKKKTTQD